MNILVFSWRDPKHPLAGGAERSMHEHMKGWVMAGHKVTLFSSRINKRPDSEVIDGVDIVRKGYQYLGVQLAGLFYYLKNNKNYDFVVDQFHGIPFFTPLYVRKPKLAVLQEVTREVWFTNPLRFPLNLIVAIIGYIFEPFVFILYRNTNFMVGSKSAKEDLIKFGINDGKITIVPHGVIPPTEKVDTRKEKIKTITFFGTVTADKGIIDAIKTFNILNKKGNYKFWVMGRFETDSYKSKVMSEVEKLGLKGNIKFWNKITDQEKFELLARSHVLINPSIREGWCIINIEANLMGTPVVAYPSQGLVDSVKNNLSGILTKTSTYHELAEVIFRVTNSNEEYKKLSAGAKKWASQFTWEKSRKLSLDLINNSIR